MEFFLHKSVFHARRPLPFFPPSAASGLTLDAACEDALAAGVACALMRHHAPRCAALFFHGNAEARRRRIGAPRRPWRTRKRVNAAARRTWS